MPVRRARPQPVILVVDDGKLHVTLLQLALTQLGYGVQIGSSSERREPHDNTVAVLVTHDLPEAALALRALGPARPRIAIAFAPPGAEGAARVYEAGFDIALTRPIDFAALDCALRARMTKPASGTRSRVPGQGRGGREGAA